VAASFEELLIEPLYINMLEDLGLKQPTSVQSEAIPPLLQGKDVIVQSQTGTGKTLAYLLPALQRIDPSEKHLQILILVPTRELGMQIMLEIEKLTQAGPIRAQALIGGAATSRQIEKLRLHPHIAVGTPGRILELVKVRKLSLHHIQTFVVDEVDQVFELGSMNEVETILKGMLKTRQLVFVSATIPKSIAEAGRKWMNEPVVIRVNPEQITSATLEHYSFVCQEREKIDTLRRLVRLINPVSAIVFINATNDIAEVVGKLQYAGLSVEALYGEAGKQERAKVMGDFREGRFQLLLATDIAARGLDIEGVTHVFHLDPPVNAEYYIHRVGRTGRMGRKGTAISIITRKEQFILDKFEKALGITIQPKAMYEGRIVDPADDRSVAAKRSRRAEARPAGGDAAGSREGAARGGSPVAAKPAFAGGAPAAASGKAAGPSKAQRERERKNKGAPKWLKAKQQKE
jgi:ATP-dependent RNA helicase DeaD